MVVLKVKKMQVISRIYFGFCLTDFLDNLFNNALMLGVG